MSEIKTKPNLHASFIDARAFEIVDRLQRKGFKTYLVGGCVRDLLLNIEPKDFDIATTALPHEIRKIIPNSYIIGKRFKLVLAKRGRDQFEIATFRREAPREEEGSNSESAVVGEEGSKEQGNSHFIFNDNFFGSPEQDALRRDFTINALFYDPIKNELIDYAGGESDLRRQLVRMIGDPSRRILEDPIRSLRAIRLAHKIQFSIEPTLRQNITKYASPVALTALPRRREEYIKLLKLRYPSLAFYELYDLGLVETCLPSLKFIFESAELSQLFAFYIDHFRPPFLDQENPSLPHIFTLVSAFYSISRSWDKTEDFLKKEFGIYRSELTVIQGAIRGAKQFPKISAFSKRSLRRKYNFLNQPWVPYAFEYLYFHRIFSPGEALQWDKELWQLTQKAPSFLGSNTVTKRRDSRP
ncbi:MAG: poly(A) polymerase [Bdellovibrionaceae bacterium]|nr:poly(A) polymerase [Pseudobdellovibrionaceae bacterium]MDW8189484.1 poly(A) polymerase [Pseudobdellovibrionaceae bacterium]